MVEDYTFFTQSTGQEIRKIIELLRAKRGAVGFARTRAIQHGLAPATKQEIAAKTITDEARREFVGDFVNCRSH